MVIDESGVVEAIRHLISDEFDGTENRVSFYHDVRFTRLDPMLEGTIFRIVQESFNNIVHHSRSQHVSVIFEEDADGLYLEIRDDGVGFEPDVVSSDHFGLRGIRERARLFGGKATITSHLGTGTSVQVRMPRSAL